MGSGTGTDRRCQLCANISNVECRPAVSTRWGAGSGGGRSGVEGLPVPGQEFGDAASWVVGDAGEPIGEIVLRVEAVELGAVDQRVEGRGAAAAGIGAGTEIIFAANSDTTQGTLGG